MGADADRMSLAFVEESSYGVAPGTQLTELRFVSESLKQNTGIQASQEIRSDRQVSDVMRTSISVGGDVAGELSYGAWDAWLEAVLLSSDWSAVVAVDTADTAISAASGDNSFNHTTAWAANPSVGRWIEVRGFTDPANNGYFRVVSVTNTKIVVEGGTLVTEAAGDSVTIKQGAEITNGTEQRSFSIEKEFTDLSNVFAAYHGCELDGFSFTLNAEQLITLGFTLIGKNEDSLSATIGTSSKAAAPTNEPMNAVDNVVKFLEGMATEDIISLSFSVANNLRARQQVGSLGPISVGTGKLSLTGQLTRYFATADLLDKYLDFAETSLALVLEDGAGNAYVIDLPRVQFTDGQRVAGGESSDIIADLQWQAFRHSTLGVTIRVQRFAA